MEEDEEDEENIDLENLHDDFGNMQIAVPVNEEGPVKKHSLAQRYA